ncbi:hypothetical protein ISG33_06570 [Glaciecola sp. MH2013]|nr:hypothetical protein [Glaciecola sp. MH2013]
MKFVVGGFGTITIVLAILSYLTNLDAMQLIQSLQKMFSTSFLLFFVPLCGLGLLSICNILNSQRTIQEKRYWAEIAQQTANGISTLALTYTLLGISLGIGALSHQSLGPDTVNAVISELTSQFSMAFMTTVVGLPCSTLIRSLASVFLAKSDLSIGS